MRNEPKIVLATTWKHPNVGGVSTHMTLLARSLGIGDDETLHFDAINGRNSDVWARTRRRLTGAMRRETLTAHAEGLIPILQRTECDILHCHDAAATWAAGVARQRFRKGYRIVSTVHGPVSRHMVEHGHPPDSAEVAAVQRCEEAAWQFSDQIIAVDATQRIICLEQGAPKDRISVIPNAVDVREIDKKLELLRCGPDPGVHWVIVPRRLAPKNGVMFAIEAAKNLPTNSKLLIAGNGIEEDRCRQLVERWGLEHRVAMLGAVPRDVILMLMGAAQAVLIPSVPAHGIVEATSIACIEAMACRVPVVASAIGGLLELVRHKETGLLVPPADPRALADAVELVLSGGECIDRMVSGARREIERRFSTEPWIADIRQVYRAALDGGLTAIA